MLKLSMKEGDYILIDEKIKVAFIGGGKKIKVLVDAPKEVKVARVAAVEKEQGTTLTRFIPEREMKVLTEEIKN